ncbi:MAG: HAD-IIIC family phosphatase [Acidobacteriota bacterium]|nr:HAD-IIIC family phosphatase [Acidobacteriota bacterium]
MKLLEALRLLQQANREGAPFPLGLICGFYAQPLRTFLAAHLQQWLPDRRIVVREGRFGDLTGNLERYLQGPCGAAAVVLEWADLDSRLGVRVHGGWGRARVHDICGVVRAQLDAIGGLLAAASGAGVFAVSLPGVPPAPVEPVPGWQYGQLQAGLDTRIASFAAGLAELPHIRLVNPGRLAALPQAERVSFASLLQTGSPYTLAAADALGEMLATAIFPPPPWKGIITDLDETLWSGVLGQAGVDGVAWDLEHRAAQHGAYQQMLQSLADSGVLIGVASKNDPDLVKQALRRPDLLLRSESVYPVEANWGAKSESVARILRAWNVGAGSVLFLDDSPLEVAEVQTAHPAMNCRIFDANPDHVASLLWELAARFGKQTDSQEDGLRLQGLRGMAELSGAVSGTGSLETVLAEAGGVMTIAPLHDPPDPRALELVNKTNQFNLNGRRIGEADWLRFLRTPGRGAWMASYRDRFGALGKICVLTGRLEAGALHVDNWVLSCRAFGRRIEYAMLAALIEQFQLARIHFRFERTERNTPMREMLEGLVDGPLEGEVILNVKDFVRRRRPSFMNVELLYGTEQAHASN